MVILKNKPQPQGDILIVPVDSLPDGLREVEPVDGKHIVAHSETGHHHLLDARNAKLLQGDDPNVCYLMVTGDYADLVHDRPGQHPHDTVRITKQVTVYRQRETTPLGLRQVQD